jgi:hypothetical protein
VWLLRKGGNRFSTKKIIKKTIKKKLRYFFDLKKMTGKKKKKKKKWKPPFASASERLILNSDNLDKNLGRDSPNS